jgi:hypothetical protein
MGYGFSRPAPTTVKPDDNVMVANVSNFLQRTDGFGDERTLHRQQYADWGKVTRNLGWRPNIGNPAGVLMGMPDVAPHQAAEDMRFVAGNGCLGLYMDTYWEYWSTQGIQYYTLAQLAWNPYLNIDSLLDDYYSRAYGPAAAEMKSYWTLMENARNELLEKVKTRARFLRVYEVYTDKWFADAEKLLQNAAARAKTGDPVYAQRVDYTAKGLQFARLLVETRKLNAEWEKDKKNLQLQKAIDAKWAEGKAMSAGFPPYAINFQKMFNNPKNSGLQGLHYLNPVNDKTLRRTENIPGYE